MRMKTLFGWTILLILALLPLVPWYFLGPSYPHDYANVTHALGQAAGLIGMTLFAITFILSMRLRFVEEIFGGLDKVYRVHAVTGASALMAILFHPLFLILKYIPEHMKLAAEYLLPNTYWSVNFGIIALTGMILLIFITLYVKMRYHLWKFSHKFLGLVFVLAIFHVFLIRFDIARDNIFPGYFIYVAIVSVVGLSAFLYSLLLKDSNRVLYKLESIKKIGHCYHLSLTPLRSPISYQAGQFVFLSFYNPKITSESHPFSIASATGSSPLKFVIKADGDFTSQLHVLKPGDRVSVDGPYGRFYPHEESNEIWIAGGVGITPFLGLAADYAQKKRTAKVDLYYSVKTQEEFISFQNFNALEKWSRGAFSFYPWVSDQQGKLTINDILKKSSLKDVSVFLCGPQPLKEYFIVEFIKCSVPKDKIYLEDFSFK